MITARSSKLAIRVRFPSPALRVLPGDSLLVDVDIVRRCLVLGEREDLVDGGLGKGLGGRMVWA